MDHAPVVLVALTVAWLSSRWNQHLGPALRALTTHRPHRPTTRPERQPGLLARFRSGAARRTAPGTRPTTAGRPTTTRAGRQPGLVARFGFGAPHRPTTTRAGRRPGSGGLGWVGVLGWFGYGGDDRRGARVYRAVRRSERRAAAGVLVASVPVDTGGRACLRVDVGYEVSLPALRSFVHSEVARHPAFDGRAWGVQAADATRTAVVVRVWATAATVHGARCLEADLRAAVVGFATQDYPESLDGETAGGRLLAVPAVILDR